MAEDFGDNMGASLAGTAKQLAGGAVKQAAVTLAGEAKDMLAASKELAGGTGAPAREHLVEKPDLSR